MTFREKSAWLLGVGLVWLGILYMLFFHHSTAASASPSAVADPSVANWLKEGEHQGKQGRYQLSHQDHLLVIFDTVTAEMWMGSQGSWVKVNPPSEILGRESTALLSALTNTPTQ